MRPREREKSSKNRKMMEEHCAAVRNLPTRAESRGDSRAEKKGEGIARDSRGARALDGLLNVHCNGKKVTKTDCSKKLREREVFHRQGSGRMRSDRRPVGQRVSYQGKGEGHLARAGMGEKREGTLLGKSPAKGIQNKKNGVLARRRSR